MECDLIALGVSPGIGAGYCQFARDPLRTYSVGLHSKISPSVRSLLLSRLKSCSCAVVNVVESNPISDVTQKHARNSEKRVHQVGLDYRNVGDQGIVGGNVKARSLVGDGKKRLIQYSGMLRTCASQGALNEGKAIHGQVVKNGIHPDMHLWVSLVNIYSKCGDSLYARKVLGEMPDRDVVSWTTLIHGFVVKGLGVDAVNLFCEMKKDGTRANDFSLATGLKACSLCLDLGFGKQLHAEAVKAGFFSDDFVGSALVDLYAKCGQLELANKVLFCMPEQNVVSWNALLNGYAQEGNGNQVLKLFCKMTESDMRLNKFTLSTVLKGCATVENLRAGRVVHSLVVKVG